MKTQKILWTFAAILALAGTILLNIAGMRFSGALSWAAAIVVIVYAVLAHKKDCRWAKWARRALLALICAGLALFAWCEALVIGGAQGDAAGKDVSCVVILGAGVNGTEPSLMLASRLQAALDYVSDKPALPIVCSGGQGEGEDITEAECMARWLVSHGIKEARILREERSSNTEENFAFSTELMAQHGIGAQESFAFVTSDYHIARAKRLAGGESAYGVAAHLPRTAYYDALELNYYIREAFAMAKLLVIGG